MTSQGERSPIGAQAALEDRPEREPAAHGDVEAERQTSARHYKLSRRGVRAQQNQGRTERETDRRHRPELGRYGCTGFHRSHLPCPRRAEICRRAWGCDGVLRQGRGPGARSHGAIRRDPGGRWRCPAHRRSRHTLDQPPVRHRNDRYDLWVQIPARGWNASDLDRALLASSLLLVLAGSGRAGLDAIWLEKGEQSELT